MSASCYTHRIKVKTQARNAKVQYPGGRAMYNPLHATCAINPNYTVLNYIGKPISLYRNCCLPINDEILNGQFSTKTIGCILDGGFSMSNYTPNLDGGNSLT